MGGETTTEEMYSTEDISSTYDSDSDSDSEESEEGSSSDISSTDSSDSGSDDSDSVSSDDTDSSSDSDNVNTVSAEDDNDTDDNTDVFGAEGEDNGDDGRALESESDDQNSSDSDSDDVSSTAQGEDDEDDVDTEFDDAGDDDVCLGLDSSECGNTFGDDGMQMCGYNTNTDDCFEVVMTAGQRGRGNFDDGYTMAQAELDEQASQLYTVIGILGGLVGLLVLTVMGGAYYIYSNKKQFGHSAVPMSIIDIDGGRTTTRGQHNRLESHSYHHSADITPMLD